MNYLIDIEDIVDNVIHDRLNSDEYNVEYKNRLKKMWTDSNYMSGLINGVVKDSGVRDFLKDIVDDYIDDYIHDFKEETYE